MADLNITLTIKELKQIATDYFAITFGKPREIIYQSMVFYLTKDIHLYLLQEE